MVAVLVLALAGVDESRMFGDKLQCAKSNGLKDMFWGETDNLQMAPSSSSLTAASCGAWSAQGNWRKSCVDADNSFQLTWDTQGINKGS